MLQLQLYTHQLFLYVFQQATTLSLCDILTFIIVTQIMHEHISSDRLISHHRTREDYSESPVNTLQFAYGDQRYTKMTYQLLRESDILKQKILNQAIQDFCLCENINLALLSSDLLSVVLQHFKNQHETIRLLSARLFNKVCASPMGRKTIILKNCVQAFHALTHDNLTTVKSEAYDGLIDFAQHTEGITCILSKQKILVQLVDKLIQEKVPQILLKAIILLKILMQGEDGTPKALSTEIISRLMNLISHKYPAIQHNVCLTLANISFDETGKLAIVTKGHIKEITKYVNHSDKSLREAVSLLLCSLAQINQGKNQILAYCPFSQIVKLLDDQSPTVLNTVQLIANLAQNPQGKALSKEIEGKLESIESIERKYIDQTLQVIRWKP